VALRCGSPRPCLFELSGASVTAGYFHSYPLERKLELLTKWASHIEPAEGVTLLR
jgi:hypothetical protein